MAECSKQNLPFLIETVTAKGNDKMCFPLPKPSQPPIWKHM